MAPTKAKLAGTSARPEARPKKLTVLLRAANKTQVFVV
jgi:hypothetical protein